MPILSEESCVTIHIQFDFAQFLSNELNSLVASRVIRSPEFMTLVSFNEELKALVERKKKLIKVLEAIEIPVPENEELLKGLVKKLDEMYTKPTIKAVKRRAKDLVEKHSEPTVVMTISENDK